MFYMARMLDSALEPAAGAIRSAILSAPAMTRLGLACASEAERERAADDLTQQIIERLQVARDQLRLAL